LQSAGCEILPPPVIPPEEQPAPPEEKPIPPEDIFQGITPLIMLFDQINYQGNSITITEDNPDLRKTYFGQDVASSIKVFGGAMATLFQHINYGGRSEVFTKDDPNLGNNFIGDDVLSSIKISYGEPEKIQPGNLLKNFEETVYYYGWDGKRHTFPTRSTYDTWYSNFNTVKNLSSEQLSKIPLGVNVTFRPGVKMIKLETDPKVYAVDANGTLRWITTEDLAAQLYGAEWASLVADLNDSFFADYTVGLDINSETDFSPVKATATATSIDVDKNLAKVSVALLPKL